MNSLASVTSREAHWFQKVKKTFLWVGIGLSLLGLSYLVTYLGCRRVQGLASWTNKFVGLESYCSLFTFVYFNFCFLGHVCDRRLPATLWIYVCGGIGVPYHGNLYRAGRHPTYCSLSRVYYQWSFTDSEFLRVPTFPSSHLCGWPFSFLCLYRFILFGLYYTWRGVFFYLIKVVS